MTYLEITERVNELLRISEPYTDEQKKEIEQISLLVLRVPVKDCNCTNRWFDALVSCRKWLKCHAELNNCKYEMQRGMMFRYNGALITNTNLTDEAAEWFMKEFPEYEKSFTKILTEEAPKEEDEVNTPNLKSVGILTKKTAKKRK